MSRMMVDVERVVEIIRASDTASDALEALSTLEATEAIEAPDLPGYPHIPEPPVEKPALMDRASLIRLFESTIAMLREDDTAHGHLEYQWGEERGIYEVIAFLRIGNSQGQGGVRMVGEGTMPNRGY